MVEDCKPKLTATIETIKMRSRKVTCPCFCEKGDFKRSP